MSNDRLEPFNYHNIAFKRCADVVSLERLDRLWFFRHHWFVKIGWFGKCWTDLLAFWGVWNRSRILNFGPDRLFFRFSRALPITLSKVLLNVLLALWQSGKLARLSHLYSNFESFDSLIFLPGMYKSLVQFINPTHIFLLAQVQHLLYCSLQRNKIIHVASYKRGR